MIIQSQGYQNIPKTPKTVSTFQLLPAIAAHIIGDSTEGSPLVRRRQSFSQSSNYTKIAMKPRTAAPTIKPIVPSPAKLPAAPVNMGSPEEVGVAAPLEGVLELTVEVEVVALISLLLLLTLWLLVMVSVLTEDGIEYIVGVGMWYVLLPIADGTPVPVPVLQLFQEVYRLVAVLLGSSQLETGVVDAKVVEELEGADGDEVDMIGSAEDETHAEIVTYTVVVTLLYSQALVVAAGSEWIIEEDSLLGKGATGGVRSGMAVVIWATGVD